MNFIEHFGHDIRALLHTTTSTVTKLGVLCDAKTEQIKLGGISREDKALLDALLVRATAVSRRASAIAQNLATLDAATDPKPISAKS